jgi:hypothetical protein
MKKNLCRVTVLIQLNSARKIMTDLKMVTETIITIVTVAKEITTETEIKAVIKDVITTGAVINKDVLTAVNKETIADLEIITQAAEGIITVSRDAQIQTDVQNRKNSLNHYW